MNTQFELRQSGDRKTWNLTGYASRTGIPYKVHDHRGSYTEVIEHGAFRGALKAAPDVVLAVEHAPPYCARTPKTLQLEENSRGLRVSATLDHEDPDVRSLVSKVRNGILSEMSLAFRCDDNFAGSGTRSIRALSLEGGDVSCVRRGANRSTEVSVRGRPPGAFEIRSSGLIALRQEDDDDDGEDTIECPTCGGVGLVNGATCPRCDGTGQIDPDDLDDATSTHVGRSADFTDAQKAALGKVGKAVYIDGHWAYPTPTRSSYDDAVQALGRTPGKNRQTVRRYLMKRARAEGWPVPSSWNSDGSTSSGSRSSPSVIDLEVRASRAKSRALEARFEAVYGDRLLRTEARHVTRCGQLADEAIARGDTRAAAMWMRQEAAELDALALGR